MKADVPAALHHAYYDGLVAMRAATLAFHPATNERFISLDYGLEKLGVKLIERGTESMAQISRSLVGHVRRALELICRGALFGLYDKVNCYDPFPQRKVRVVKDGASGNGEAIAA